MEGGMEWGKVKVCVAVQTRSISARIYIAMQPVAATVISEYPLPLIGQPSLAARHDVSEDPNGDVTFKLEVVLAIAMPSQHSANRHQTGYACDDEGRPFEPGRPDYALGLCRCVWLREKG